MVKEKDYLINEAAKEVHVESHVLRYWEDELKLPIRRNEQGHRIYTQEDIDRFIKIKELKDKGLQLKAVKMVLNQMNDAREGEEDMKSDNPFAQKQLTKISKNGDMKVIQLKPSEDSKWKGHHMIEVKEKKVSAAQKQEIALKMKENEKLQELQQEKVARMQYLFQKMIKDAVEENNHVIIGQISEHIKDDMCKELDYQFRLMEEREEERESIRREKDLKQQEEHFKRIDELLQQYRKKNIKRDKKEQNQDEKKQKEKKEFCLWRRLEAK